MYLILALFLFILPLVGPISIEPIVSFKGLWETKEFLAVMAIVCVCLTEWRGKIGFKNPWLKCLIVFLVVSSYMIPPIHLLWGDADLGGLWVFKSLLFCLLYIFLLLKITSNPPSELEKKVIGLAISYSALVSAAYAMLQWLGLDQFQTVFTMQWQAVRPAAEITAMIGNPVYLGVFLGLSLPFAFLHLNKWQIFIIIFAMILTQSDTIFGFWIVFLVLWTASRMGEKAVSLACGLILIAGLACGVFFIKDAPRWLETRFNGRLAVWADTIKDWKSPPIAIPVNESMSYDERTRIETLNKRTWPLTGRGLGSFEYLYQKQKGWNDPHNVYLRALYEIGLIGLVLFIGMIGYVLMRTLTQRVEAGTSAMLVSFLFACFSGVTLPVLTVEPLRFYMAVIFCFLSIIASSTERDT